MNIEIDVVCKTAKNLRICTGNGIQFDTKILYTKTNYNVYDS
jgi:hypothetical protein